MLSHKLDKLVPVVALLAATGCDGTEDEPLADVEPRAEWVLTRGDRIRGLRVEQGRGDVVILDDVGLTRLDADGGELFRLPQGSETFVQDVAFLPNGNLVALGGCFAPTSFAGVDVCTELDPTQPSQLAMLVEIDRGGTGVHATTLSTEGSGSLSPTAMAVAEDGRLHLGGSFAGLVTLGDDTIETVAPSSTQPPPQSIFYLQLETDHSPRLLRDFGGASASVDAIALDPASNEAFMIGTFVGDARFSGINLTSGPNGQAIFLSRLGEDGEPAWAKHFTGSGQFRARFDDDGGILIYGRGSAPYTSLGGDRVIDGPFATRLEASGDHAWTWRAHDDRSGASATIDTEGRVVALYTDETLIRPEVVPEEDCYDDFWRPECEYQPAEYAYRRRLEIFDPAADRKLGGRTIQSSDYGGFQGTVAMSPDGSTIVAEQASGDGSVDFGDGPVRADTVVAKIRLVEQP